MELTPAIDAITIAAVSVRKGGKAGTFRPAEVFGTWLKYVRQLTGLTQRGAAKEARVSYDAIKRMERGQLVGSAHLLAYLHWLVFTSAEPTDTTGMEGDHIDEVRDDWPTRVLTLGEKIRAAGLADKPPKAKSLMTNASPLRKSGR